jgi:hypothetical protein
LQQRRHAQTFYGFFMSFLWQAILGWWWTDLMLTLVNIPSSGTASREAASLVSDYLAFDRQRTTRRQYLKAFGGMAILVLLGAVFGSVPRGEAMVVAAMLILPPLPLAVDEAIRWRRLIRRLHNARVQAQAVRKS